MYYVVTPWKVFGDFSFNQLALCAICCLLHDLKYCILFQHVRPTDNIIAVIQELKIIVLHFFQSLSTVRLYQ